MALKLYTIHGKSKCMTAWAREYGINPNTVQSRMRIQGMTIEEAILYNKANTGCKRYDCLTNEGGLCSLLTDGILSRNDLPIEKMGDGCPEYEDAYWWYYHMRQEVRYGKKENTETFEEESRKVLLSDDCNHYHNFTHRRYR